MLRFSKNPCRPTTHWRTYRKTSLRRRHCQQGDWPETNPVHRNRSPPSRVSPVPVVASMMIVSILSSPNWNVSSPGSVIVSALAPAWMVRVSMPVVSLLSRTRLPSVMFAPSLKLTSLPDVPNAVIASVPVRPSSSSANRPRDRSEPSD